VSFYSGKDGKLLIDGVAAGKVRNWSISASQSALDTTTLGDLDRTITEGIRSTTGSCQLFYYAPNPLHPETNSASVLINKLLKPSATGQGAASARATLRLHIEDGTVTGKYIEGECILTSVSMAMAVGEVLSADVAFEFNGAPRAMVL
jgi:hypothetical protein